MSVRKILVIDDDAASLDILSRFFEKQGITVVTAEDGQIGVAKMKEGPYSLIFLDLNMPNMNGMEALPLIHEEAGSAEIVIMTAHASYETKMSARELGIYDYMVKPITLGRLQELANALIPDAGSEDDLVSDEGHARLGLDVTKIDVEVVQLIPERIARALFLVAVGKHENTLTVAMVDPEDQAAMDRVRKETGLEVMTLHADRQDILDAIQIGYGEVVPEVKRVEGDSSTDEPSGALIDDEPPYRDSHEQSVDGPDAALVLPELDVDNTTATEVLQRTLAHAISQNATVIFIEPQTQNAVIRFRGGGLVRPYGRITKRTCATVIAKVRELALSQSVDSLSPSQGRFRVRIQKMVRTFSYHNVSTIHGESTVVRLHSPFERAAGIADLGFGEKALQLFISTVEQPDGLILVTGPPEHGQMTTLYAALQHLNAPNRKIVTLEDPVTSAVDGFTQVSIRFDMGQSYASALHDLRHHDPDIILIEDTSDAEAASVATQIAATGRKVLGIVASPDAISCVDQLRSQGVPPFLISRALRLVLTQYKLKRLCQQCKTEADPSTEMFERVQNYVQEDVSVTSFVSPGCDACSNTGYRGFSMVYEFLPIGEPLKDAILMGSDSATLRQIAYPKGRSSLFDAGLNRVNRGVITLNDFLTTIMHH